ncbi:MAG: hypothetical protein LBH04_04000 [Tannerellaceae bacterium]|nr:hypothetical protein [Tannerellaceae bacterium]
MTIFEISNKVLICYETFSRSPWTFRIADKMFTQFVTKRNMNAMTLSRQTFNSMPGAIVPPCLKFNRKFSGKTSKQNSP